MTEADPKLVDSIFGEALDLHGAERIAYIEKHCSGDTCLRARVLKLIQAAEATGDGIDGRFGTTRERMFRHLFHDAEGEESEDLTGLRVNVWNLEKRIARGGLATVYLAHRADGTFDQLAAFKVLRRGLDTDDLVARFRAERQILSSLDHPSIAAILDGGALEDGRPYLVLEFVDGEPVTDYCKHHSIPIRDRILLLLDVLSALRHAHQHLIVHRDIKPSNILVSGEGRVSLLDFGIAKILDPGAVPGASALTRTGMSLLTPGYCSPEQHAGRTVTTASDIYQAGAVLYELLTESRPRTATGSDTSVSLPAPSRMLSDRADVKAVRGDLDAIVSKAMHVDPEQRYASADEMEADLRRYLDGRPVTACPDTLGYRIGKLQKRRPLILPVAALAIAATLGYVYTLLDYNKQLQIEQHRTSAAQMFMVEILSSPDPFRPADPGRGSNITVVEALDLGASRLETELAGDAKLKASVLASISRVYSSLDRQDRAIEMREEALEIERELFGEPSEPVRASLEMLARDYVATNDYEKAIRYSQMQLDFARSLYSVDSPALGAAEVAGGEVAAAVGDFTQSRALWENGIEKMRRAGDQYSHQFVRALSLLADQLRFEEPGTASKLLVEASNRTEAIYGADSLPMARIRAQAASLYSAAREYQLAEQEFLAVIPMYESHVGRDHSETLSVINNLGILYNRMELPAKAETAYREVLDRYRQKYGENHRTVADSYQNLATAITRAGRYAESIPMHQKAYEIYREVLPEEQPAVAYPLISKAYAEVNHGLFQSAENTGREALDIIERTDAGEYLEGVANCLIARALEGKNDDRALTIMTKAQQMLIGSIVSDTYRKFCRVPYQ